MSGAVPDRTPVLQVEAVKKSYGRLTALDGGQPVGGRR